MRAKLNRSRTRSRAANPELRRLVRVARELPQPTCHRIVVADSTKSR